MCGIAAIFSYRSGEPISRQELTSIRDAMTARGPDGFGNWISADHRVGLGHRRLSIIDLSPSGAQPMKNHDGSLVITFNGEIYNYRELRSTLEQKGYRFQSTSDTEVLLHLYDAEGEAMLDSLRGMFAFAIWDDRKKGLFVARDPFGIKPLYFADDGETLRLASQVKALLAGGQIDTAPEPAGHVGFFLWGHVPDPFTLYKSISALPAGCRMWVPQDGAPQLRSFCDIPALLAEAEAAAWTSDFGVRTSDFEPTHRRTNTPTHRRTDALKNPLPSPLSPLLSSALRDSIRHHLIADVPVGVFLSSGLDSTTIAALAVECSASLRTVTLGFEEFRGSDNDETPLAESVANQYGATHQTIWITRRDFLDQRDRLLAAMDQPSIDGVNTYFVSHAASQAGLKVALSGLGGDELFGGYPSFRQLPRSVNALSALRHAPALGRVFRILSGPLLKRMTSPKYSGLLEYGGTYGGAYLLRRGMFMPWELPSLLDPDLVREGWDRLQTLARLEETTKDLHSPRLRVSALEMTWYMRNQLLRDTDWASMDHSLEVRTPLVDLQLLKNLAPLFVGARPPTKHDMALAVGENVESRKQKVENSDQGPEISAFNFQLSALPASPLSALPSAILTRKKTGFTTPVRDWLLEDSQPSSVDRGLRGWARHVYGYFEKSVGTRSAAVVPLSVVSPSVVS